LTKIPLIYSVSHLTFGRLGVLFGGLSSPKLSVATGLVTNRRLFWKPYYQTMPGVA